MMKRGDIYRVVIIVISWLVFATTVMWFTRNPQPRREAEMSVAIPALVQLGFACGDRYLSANIGVFRALTVGTHDLEANTYETLAQVQVTAAQMNPRHEDNYYTAAAILAWNRQVDAAQTVLNYATNARDKDALPPFFRGFNKYYFYRDFIGGARDLTLAAERSVGGNSSSLRSIAARWFERGYEPAQARNVIASMARSSNDPRVVSLLTARAARLDGLVVLQAAAKQYQREFGHPPDKLVQLVEKKIISNIPTDPLGDGYVLDSNGVPQIAMQLSPKTK
ncbi:hypothetical protein ACUHMQ_16015 [Chitinimonas sp. PSY-7]|uniref:hypothetical protein n=1 Tax=Chitinimonas sp. PSY-7 TaxID=3459088 RepID=UPI0040400378